MQKTILVKLKDIYFHELGFLSTIVRDSLAHVFRTAKPPETEGERLFHILPMDIQARIWSALTAAAGVRNLLDDQRPRNERHETAEAYEVRLARAEMLKAELDGITLTEVFKGRMRNIFEHFDEYLDDLNVKVRALTTPSVANYNIGVTHIDNVIVEGGTVHHLRTYESTTRMLFYLDGSTDLGKLHDEAAAILTRLIERKLIKEDGTTGVMSFLDFPKPAAVGGAA